jgi:hypothetical protein
VRTGTASEVLRGKSRPQAGMHAAPGHVSAFNSLLSKLYLGGELQ